MYFFKLKSNLLGQPTFLANFLTPEECNAIIGRGESALEL
jgi:hypothetical protein